MNFRSRELLDLAYELECTLEIPGECVGGVGEPCHSNWHEHGKGGSIKAHDCFFASGCRGCHRALDQGSKLSKEDRKHYWQRGHDRTMLELWKMGYIGVTK